MTETIDITRAVRIASRLVAALFDLPPDHFTGASKGPPAQVHARQVLCYLLHTEGEFDQAAIADALGRHRSTVGHAVAVITSLREHPQVDTALDRLCDMFRELAEAHARIPVLVEEIAP